MAIKFKWAENPKTDAEISEIMEAAMTALRLAAPNLPIMTIIAFNADEEGSTYICTGSNIDPEQQYVMLSYALHAKPDHATLN